MKGNTVKAKIKNCAKAAIGEISVKSDGGNAFTVYCKPEYNFAVCYAISRAGYQRQANTGSTIQITI